MLDQTAPLPSSAPRLSIVVLPFANIGGDPEQEYFVDGVTESLTTDLSRISGAFVIARNTAFTFKGKAVDVKKLGRELNVRYVLEGSVQRGGNRLRVNVQLIDAETGNHLWAERFDKPVADLFDMQDEIVSRLANTLDAELIAAEARRAERSPHPDAMDLCFQGSGLVQQGAEPPNTWHKRAASSRRALALDPGNVEAMVGLAWVDFAIGANLLTDDRISASRRSRGDRHEGAVPRTEPSLWLTASWASCKFLRTARLKASQNASGRWRWIAIWPALMRSSGLPSFSWSRRRNRSSHQARRSAFLLATPSPISGCMFVGLAKLAARCRCRSGCLAAPGP